MKENEPVMIDRKEEIRENIRVFDKLSPSKKIRYIESARKRLKYYRTLKFLPKVLCIVFLLVVPVLTGCGTQSSGKIGDRPPAFTLPDMQGGRVSLKGQEGKLVVVYFWSDSCACAKKLPLLNGYYGANKTKGLEILAVNAGQPRSAVEEYLKTNVLTYPVLLDTDMKTAKQFGVTGLPTVYIVDRQGMIRQKLIGEVEMDVLMKLLTKLM